MAQNSDILVLEQGSNDYIGWGGVISTIIFFVLIKDLFNYVSVCYASILNFFFLEFRKFIGLDNP